MNRTGFSLMEALLVVAILGVLAALVLPAVQWARAAAARSVCQNHLHQIGIALANYESTHQVFFPAKINPGSYQPRPGDSFYPVLGGGTKNTTGWLLLLPFLGEEGLYAAYNHDLCSSANATASLPWMPVAGSDAANSTVVGQRLEILLCPADQTPTSRTWNPDSPGDPGSMRLGFPASYLFSSGGHGESGPIFPLLARSEARGMFGINGAARLEEVTDGLSRSVAVGESLHSGGKKGDGPWWGAGVAGCCLGLTHREGGTRFSSAHGASFQVLFGDGSVQLLSSSLDKNVWFALTTIHGNDADSGGL